MSWSAHPSSPLPRSPCRRATACSTAAQATASGCSSGRRPSWPLHSCSRPAGLDRHLGRSVRVGLRLWFRLGFRVWLRSRCDRVSVRSKRRGRHGHHSFRCGVPPVRSTQTWPNMHHRGRLAGGDARVTPPTGMVAAALHECSNGQREFRIAVSADGSVKFQKPASSSTLGVIFLQF